jgi:hypothetical protein
MGRIHRIFDKLDGTTMLFSVRNVCQLLRVAVDNYHRHALDFTWISKPDFYRRFPLVRPGFVTALSLSDVKTTFGQIGLFLSLVDLHVFTRLRSLTLLNIDCKSQGLCAFLEHADRCSIRSLALRSTSYNCLEEQEIAQRLSPILCQPTLLRPELLNVNGQSNANCDICEWNRVLMKSSPR